MAEHVLTWQEVFQGHGEMQLSPEATIRLAELAGAPWNDFDPHAKLSDVQKEIITRPERVVIVFGGSRGGKSIAGACIALAQLIIPNSQIALIGATYDHCAKEFGYIWKGFFKIFPRSAAKQAHFVARQPHFSMMIETIWGSRIQVYSTNTKEGMQLLGNEFDLAVLCEAAQVNADVWNVKVERALMGRAKQRSGQNYLRRTGRGILLTTPHSQGGASYDIYARAVERTRGRIDALRVENGAGWFESMFFGQYSVIEMNPTYPREAFEAARKTLPKHAFEEQFLGKAILRSGLVYSSFREDVHVLDRIHLPDSEVLKRSRFGVGLDTGNNFAAILVCMTPDGVLYVIGETYTVGQTVKDDAAAVEEMLQERLGPLFADPKVAVQSWAIDVNSQQILDYEEALGVDLWRQKYDVLDSLGHLDMRMGEKQIFLVEDLYYSLGELRSFRWREKLVRSAGGSRDQTTGTDHAMDAFRYIAMVMFEEGPPQPGEVIWTVDQMLEQEREEMLTPNLKRDLESFERRQALEAIGGVW